MRVLSREHSRDSWLVATLMIVTVYIVLTICPESSWEKKKIHIIFPYFLPFFTEDQEYLTTFYTKINEQVYLLLFLIYRPPKIITLA